MSTFFRMWTTEKWESFAAAVPRPVHAAGGSTTCYKASHGLPADHPLPGGFLELVIPLPASATLEAKADHARAFAVTHPAVTAVAIGDRPPLQ